ncbi:MAG: ABC transporter ATP-binding protein [Eubacterium sp.]|nr:ABC transporter ATP-binding protein [Eubacterium sp.]
MLINIEHIKKGYGDKSNRNEVLKDVSLQIEEGEICVIFGPSGSGKSTLLNILGALDQPDEGRVTVCGKELHKMKMNELAKYRRDDLGFVFQFYNLIPDLTVIENIQVCENLSPNPLDINELIKTLGLEEHKYKFPYQLSGGQQQRCAIARALVKNPQLLLCDEPTGALDYSISKEMLGLLKKVNEEYGTTIVIVTHNNAIGDMANHIIAIRDGKISKESHNDEPCDVEKLSW